MKSSAAKIQITSFEDLLKPQEDSNGLKERVQEIKLEELFPFKDHPFKVQDDETMQEMAESIQEYGVLIPGLARPRSEGGFELIAGHRRKHGCELAGLDTMPIIVRELDDDSATIAMVDSNFQREKLLPSEKAFAYRMKLEAMNHQGTRTDLTYSQDGNKSVSKTSSEILAEQSGESKNQIFRYIRLTYLILALRDMVDQGRLAFVPGVVLSYLTEDEQNTLNDVMTTMNCVPSADQATRLKERSKETGLTKDFIEAVLSETKTAAEKLTLKGEKLRTFFPKDYSTRQMEETIFELLKEWKNAQH